MKPLNSLYTAVVNIAIPMLENGVTLLTEVEEMALGNPAVTPSGICAIEMCQVCTEDTNKHVSGHTLCQ